MSNYTEKKIRASKAKVGMVLARSVYSSSGAILLSSGVMLTDTTIASIARDMGITHLYIAEKAESTAPVVRQQEITVPNHRIRDTDFNIESSFASLAGTSPVVGVPEVVYPVNIDDIHSSFVAREEFKVFEEDYRKKEIAVRDSLKDISDGALLDVDRLFSLTDGIMGNLQNKGDVFMYINNLKVKDEYTFSHSANVSMLANCFGGWLGMQGDRLELLTVAGLLHDIGKTVIPDAVLNKKGKLSDDEFNEIKKHTTYGYQILLKHNNVDNAIKCAALMHHEKLDGTGYPLRLKDEKIDTTAKIIAICDIYDAMTANRVYRSKICPFDVIRQFEQSSFGHLDTAYLLVFLRHIAGTYVGAKAVLSDGRVGEIIFVNQNDLSRPMVRVDDGGDIVDLHKTPEVTILAVK